MTRWPECPFCHDFCVCGQVDALRRPIHYGCQAELPREERHPQLAEYPTSFAEERQREWRRRQAIVEKRLAELARRKGTTK